MLGNSEIAATIRVGRNSLYDVHSDHLDTPRMLTSGADVPSWRASYEAFGKAYVSSDPDGTPVTLPPDFDFNIRFPGQYYDAESGLHYNRFRYYSPDVGRYVSADPIGQVGLLSSFNTRAGANLYGYVANNPLRWIDALGLSPQDVDKIKAWADSHYADRQASGQSSSVPSGDSEAAARARGALTNLCASTPGTSCEGCGDAANDTVDAFNKAKGDLGLDDDWTITPVDDSDGPIYPQNGDPTQTNILPHSTTNITSSNPSDPNIRVDAHRSQTRVQP